VEGRDIGVALAQIGVAIGIGKELFEKAQRVGIPRRHVQVLAKRMVIELGEEAHQIVGDIAPGRERPENIDLFAIETHHLI